MRTPLVSRQVHQLVEAGNVVKDGWNGYNILHDAASRVAALDLGFLPSAEVCPFTHSCTPACPRV